MSETGSQNHKVTFKRGEVVQFTKADGTVVTGTVSGASGPNALNLDVDGTVRRVKRDRIRKV